MVKADLKGYWLNTPTKTLLFVAPVQINNGWHWNDMYKGYSKGAVNPAQTTVLQNEFLALCIDA